jgi:glutathione peroxidase-family protein/uncharacterized membrane protein
MKKKLSTLQLLASILLGSFMILAAIGHFTFQREEFQAQVPHWLPFSKDFVVIASGLAELLLGLGMVFGGKYRSKAGLALAAFFVLIFPGNIAQYLNGINAFGLDTDQARFTRLFFQPVLIAWALWASGAWALLKSKRQADDAHKSFYDFEARDIKGQNVPMRNFEGKVLLVVNTASQCGLTPQLEGLEQLYRKYQDKGLVVLGFPSNQFANQEPGNEHDIAEFCSLNYGVSFPMFSKTEVNGSNAHPLFVYLKEAQGGFLSNEVKWNFTKFLIDRQGHPVKRYAPVTKPSAIESDIAALLS